MREIKFKAHVKRLGWIVPVERINFDCKTVEVDLTNGNGDIAEYDFGEIDLMEFTGLHDKNGKEIYEGDIVRVKHPWRDREYVGEITYDKGMFVADKFYFTHQDDPWNIWESIEHVEAIGNIYENTEATP